MRLFSRIAVLTLPFLLALPLTAQTGRVVIVQTNSAGDSVHLIDPATDRIVAMGLAIPALESPAVGDQLYVAAPVAFS